MEVLIPTQQFHGLVEEFNVAQNITRHNVSTTQISKSMLNMFNAKKNLRCLVLMLRFANWMSLLFCCGQNIDPSVLQFDQLQRLLVWGCLITDHWNKDKRQLCNGDLDMTLMFG